MGCDIHSRAEKKIDGKWQVINGFHPFDWRSYGMFGFLANVRNYSAIPPITEQRGLPPDLAPMGDYDYLGDHSFSWLTVTELLSFNYDLSFEDRRYMDKTGNGGATADLGKGTIVTFREFLGKDFFIDLVRLKEIGAERIIFGFDS